MIRILKFIRFTTVEMHDFSASYQMELLNATNPQNVGVQRILEFGGMDNGPEVVAAISTEKLFYVFCQDRFYIIAV